MFEQDHPSFLESISTLSGAQGALREALTDMQAKRREVDGREITPLDFDDARTRFMLILQNLPTDVASVSVTVQFPRITGEPANGAERETKTVQFLLGKLEPVTRDQKEIYFTFVVRTNFFPDALRQESHGSHARHLVDTEVVETLKVGYSSEVHVLYIKPHGAPSSAKWGLNVKPFRLPFRYITDIILNKDREPLTPYLEGTDWETLRQVPVTYESR